MKKLLKFFRLPFRDQLLLSRTVVLILLTRLGLSILPFFLVQKLMRSFCAPGRRPRPADPSLKESVLWAVQTAGRHIRFADNCLAKALVTRMLLTRAGFEATLHIGVAKGGTRCLDAHAWVESEGVVVSGMWDPERHYQLLVGNGLKPFPTIVIMIILSIFSLRVAFADDIPPLPSGISAEVTEKRTREQLEEKILAPVAVPKLSLEEQAPAEEEAPNKAFFVHRIVLEGNTQIPGAEIDKFLSVFQERQQTLDELNGVCRQLEALFQQKGYVVVVYMPPQRLENQVVKLKVVVSKLGELHLEGATYYKESKTLSYWRIPKGEDLRFGDIRSNVLRMNENPDRAVKVVLRAGKETGYTDLILQEQDRFPFHYGTSLDDQGSRLTGKKRPSFYIKHNNLTGHDDIFLLNAAFGTEVGTAYAYHLLPLPFWDLRLASHFSHARVSPKKEFKPFDLYGISEDYGVQLRRWIFKRDTATMEGYAGFTFNEKRTRAQGSVISRDRLRMPSLGADYQSFDVNGMWILGGDWTSGLPFRENQLALTSRQAGSTFSKFDFHAKRVQRLVGDTRGVINLQGQWTRNNLTPQEEFFIGGADSNRGYPESDYGADRGFSTNWEYWIPASFLPESLRIMNFSQPLKKQAEFVLFMDQGYGRLIKASATEHASRNLLAVGAGVNFVLNDHLQADFSWGFPIGDRPLTESGSSQFYFKLQSNF